jgi:DNA helicase II / ATP-dependent DNA helicase PcrA
MTNGIDPWLLDVRGEQVMPLINEDAGTMRVEAGPGTGKTYGLKRRVLRLIHPNGLGVDPARVLVCSFNRVIANDLRAEIESELGAHGLGLPRVATVHGLCASIIGTLPRILLPHEIEAMMYDVRLSHPSLNAEHYGDQRAALRALREHEAGLADHSALITAVNEWLADHHASLIGDVTRTVSAGLDDGDYDVAQYDHVIVDEFQDLTDSEANVLVNLCADDGTFVALGDRKQSIYAFRGNDERGLDALPDLVSEEVIDRPMNECQRCPEEIVAVANAIMELEGDPLIPVRGPGGEVHRVRFDTPEEETVGIAQEVIRNYRAAPEDTHLVLVTRREWGYDLRNAIREAAPDLRVDTSFAEDVLETWAVREAFLLLEAMGAPDPVSLRDWVGYQEPDQGKNFKAPERNARAYLPLKERVGVLTVPLCEELADAPATDFSGSGKGRLIARLKRLRDLLDEFSPFEELDEIVDRVFDADRWVDYEGAHADLARDDLQRLAKESHSILEAMNEPSLQELVEHLRLRIATREPLGRDEEPQIRIVTLWGAKGLTADFVYLVGLCDQALPGRYDPDTSGLSEGDHLAEQRRLLYVSVTRARKALVMSRARRIGRGKALTLGLRVAPGWTQNLTQTRFIRDLPAGSVPPSVSGDAWEGVGG